VAGHKVAHDRVMAIGDSVRTDLKGARTVGIDFLFVTSGIHAEELGSRENPDADALTATFVAAGGMPKAGMRELGWYGSGRGRFDFAEDGVDLVLERLRVERLDDVI